MVDLCSNCGVTGVVAELGLAPEARRSRGSWLPFGRAESRALCPTCADFVAGAMRMNTSPSSGTALGLPAGAAVERRLDDEQCDYCAASLGKRSHVVSLLPLNRGSEASRTRAAGPRRSDRVCEHCALWWRATLADNSALKGTGHRAAEGGVGGWLGEPAFDSTPVALSPADGDVLRLTVTAMGQRCGLPAEPTDRALPGFAGIVFVRAGAAGAVALLAARPGDLCRQTVVVARSDAAGAAHEAMLAGAGDFLVSPLSPQQVAGAFDRLSDPAWDAERDPILGLPIVRPAAPRHGFPCHRVRVTASDGDDPWELALLLRKALRGYDRLGAGPDGCLTLLVYCRDEHLERTLGRLENVLAGTARFTVEPGESVATSSRAA